MKNKPKRQSCQKCFYWIVLNPDVNKQLGECRRHAPDADDDGKALWPRTGNCHWCGEFKHVMDGLEVLRGNESS